MLSTEQIDIKDARPDEIASQLIAACGFSILVGQDTVTLSYKGKRPTGFPIGELLSERRDGLKNVAVNPIKALAWIHEIQKRRNK